MSPSSRSWGVGDYLTHRHNPELGIGRVADVDGRTLLVEFPRTETKLRLAAATDALTPVEFTPGRPVRLVSTGEETIVVERRSDGAIELSNGHSAMPQALWPLDLEGALVDRLALGDLDDLEDFLIRLEILQLLRVREADGLGSFLGGRVRLFPHQLHVAERASASQPVRWLLADEVGLGKTIEAALILNRLVHTGRVERCLVVSPAALTVQWLGELWRKYHHVFTLLDDKRLADVARDFGADFNPFDVHRRAIVALETLVERPRLTAQAAQAGIDLLIVDEAQRLRRPRGHPGNPAWRAVAPIAALGRHLLLLSATPLEDDAHGFFRLLQLLRPDEFPEDMTVEARLALGTPLPDCTSSTRRADVGGLPPRVGIPVGLDARGDEVRHDVEDLLRRAPAANPVAIRQKSARLRRAASSGAALAAVLGPEEGDLRARASAMDRGDQRVAWLLSHVRRWRDAGEKTLVFVAYMETLEMLRTALGQGAQLASGIFHEDLAPARRDMEVARFREPDGPSLLVSTESGGEGRNFEFCRRLVLFDLPWTPSLVEQRIGRLDRIGRRMPVEIVYFRPPRGIGAGIVRVYEALGVFGEPLGGLDPQLARLETAIEETAIDPDGAFSPDTIAVVVAEAQAARTRVREAAFRQLHRDPFRRGMADGILARVPAGLDAMNEAVVISACERLGFIVERLSGRRMYSIELGSAALVESLPGVRAGSAYIGSFDREEAVDRETIDFFASGHPLIEGVFAYFEDSALGRVARFAIEMDGAVGEGLVAVYREARGFELMALDSLGRARPDWADALLEGRARVRRITDDSVESGRWRAMARDLGRRLDAGRRPHAVAVVAVRTRSTG